MSDELTNQTAEILDRQNECFVKGDVYKIMKDFSEQALLFTPDGILEGKDSIKKFYVDVTTNVLPPGSDFNIIRQEVKGETAYIVWSAESKKFRFSLGTDTFVMKDGKIIVQTFAAKIEPKN
ncbi:MAG: nuclear transport factor 2 family protein [Nitrosopumilus sp.]|nr:nuclear transport factor 2 family protein [Nitrosopumilus sp.]MDH5658660.1 nuclear transport factor 2 family protein [Nitrosopumilus sp.]